MIQPAYDIAEAACKKQLIRTDGTVAKGMKRIGTERFDDWCLAVESVLEKFNPKDE